MHVLVTGGLGFIGSNFIRYLSSQNKVTKITNLDKMSIGANLANLMDVDKKNYRFVKGDICDKKIVNKVLSDVDIIINFAAESHVDRSIAGPSSFFKSNIEGVFNLLELVRNFKELKFIQVGTDESYGNLLKGSYKEDDRLNPSSPYASSKASADMLCLSYHKTYGLDVIVTRCTNNFGPFQFPEKLIPKTIIRANLNLKVPIYGSGKNIRDWIFVMDHCEALIKIMEKGVSGEIYNVSGGNEIENIEVVEKILKILDKPKNLIEFVQDRPGHDIRYSLDSSKLRKDFNWVPKYRFSDAIEDTIAWYLDNESWWKPLIDERTIHPTPWKLEWNYTH